MNWWNDFKQWAQHPFSTDMDAFHWFLFFGLLIVVAAGWGLVLNTLHKAIGKVGP